MNSDDNLNITVTVDTSGARREVAALREHALRVLDEIRARYAELGLTPGVASLPASSGGQPGGTPSGARRA